MIETIKNKNVYGMPLPWFLLIFVLVIVGIELEVIQDKMMGGFTIALVLGVGLKWLGDQTPIIKDYGAGTIFAVLIPAILIHLGIFPESVRVIGKNFFSGYDYTSFLVPGLLVGSILAMNRKTLINAGVRFIIPMCGTIILGTLLTGALGAVLGYGFIETMLYIAGPVLGSGVSASAVPLSEIYASYGGGSPETYLTTLSSSVMIANVLTILIAAVLASLGKKNPNMFFKGFSGEGKILRNEVKVNITETQKKELVADTNQTSFTELGSGFLLTCGFYTFGMLCSRVVPSLHAYVWMIIPAIIFKLFRLTPESLEKSSGEWTRFMSKVMTPAALAAISVGVLNIGELLSLFTNPVYIILCIASVLAIVIVAAILTYLFGFYAVEGSIMAGLGLADMGGTGDVAVLSASNRMELLPFLTICSRIGGSINMVWLTFLASQFLS
ncbi:MAG: 2-hydroxycarboxylate transporter family protein [Clostridia bacterium]